MPESTPVAADAALISSVSQAGLEVRQQTQGYHPGSAGATPCPENGRGSTLLGITPQTGNRHNLMEQRPFHLFPDVTARGKAMLQDLCRAL